MTQKNTNQPKKGRAKKALGARRSADSGKHYKKRMSKQEKEVLARKIIEKTLSLLKGNCEFIAAGGKMRGQPIIGEMVGLEVIHTTPFTGVEGAPGRYGLDIWTPDKKVFSAWWEPLDLVRLTKGPWIDALLEKDLG
jgi:hypothetical protein